VSKTTGKLFALLILITSLIIAIAGLYILLTNGSQGGDDRLTLGLSAVVMVLILLILSMMWKILAGLRKTSEDESMADSPSDFFE
jgi:succinate dehydrogenase hydrophobic anchor subunit